VKTLTDLIFGETGGDQLGLLIDFVGESRGPTLEIERAFADVSVKRELG
jgi:hypothetical protein